MEQTVAVDTLRRWLERGDPVTILDVRPVAQRAEWAIPGSVYVDAYAALQAGDQQALAAIDLPADRPLVTVCGVGKTAAIAAEELRERGIDARTLEGGMAAWSMAWNSADVPIPGSDAYVIQVRRTGKGCLSYVVGSGERAIVIDAALDPDVYITLAAQHAWRITDVLDTHVHADHLSRSRLLAEHAGARLWMPESDRVAYTYEPVRDGDMVEVGAARLVALRTPGHTPESTSYVLDGRALFTGDTLFLAGVGRPDLEASPDQARARASMLYHSLQALTTLPPGTLVLPGHTSEPVSFDRRPLVTTLAEVTEGVPMLRLGEAEFVETILARIPPTPPNHARIVALNQAGELPAGHAADLEAGANRCAVS